MTSFVTLPDESPLLLHRLPSGKAVKMKAAVRTDAGTVFMGADDRIYCTFIRDRVSMRFYDARRTPALLNALVKLGAMSSADAKRHIEAMAKEDKQNNLRYSVQSLIETAHALSIGLRARDLARAKKKAGLDKPTTPD